MVISVVKVPLTMVYKTQIQLNEDSHSRPVVLVGYGAYGENQNLAYDPALMPLVDRGFIIVSFLKKCDNFLY